MRTMYRTATLAGLLLLSAGCAKRVTFPVSTYVPAAEVEARITDDDHGNAEIELEVRHLAPPERLRPPRETYVVWLETNDGRMHILGQLRVDDDLEAEFRSVAPFDEFRLFVTAEDRPDPLRPSSQVILATKVFGR